MLKLNKLRIRIGRCTILCYFAEEYMYRRPQTSAVSGKAGFFVSDFIPEEGLSGLENDVVVDSGDFGAAADGQRQQRNGQFDCLDGFGIGS